MRLLTIIALAVVLAACGRAGFRKDPLPPYQEFYSDLRTCEAEATPRWSWCAGTGCTAQHGEHVRVRNNCMKARGWEVTKRGDRYVP
jgi:hypothetical protein